MIVSIAALVAASALHMIVGALAVRAYLRGDFKLHKRTEATLMIVSGIYGWLLLHKFSEADRRRLKKVSKTIAAGQNQ